MRAIAYPRLLDHYDVDSVLALVVVASFSSLASHCGNGSSAGSQPSKADKSTDLEEGGHQSTGTLSSSCEAIDC